MPRKNKDVTLISSFSLSYINTLGVAAIIILAAIAYSAWWMSSIHSMGTIEGERLPLAGNQPSAQTMTFGGRQWTVLDTRDGQLLILSENVIKTQAFNTEGTPVTWENSSIRQLLNNEFINSFNEEDRARIMLTHVINNDNPWFGTSGGNDTYDYVFLLSVDEIVQYLGDSGQLQNRVDDAWRIEDRFNSFRVAFDLYDDAMWWWSRTMGLTEERVINVGFAGYVLIDGFPVAENGGVRPAMWITE